MDIVAFKQSDSLTKKKSILDKKIFLVILGIAFTIGTIYLLYSMDVKILFKSSPKVFIAIICNDDACETAKKAYKSWGRSLLGYLRRSKIYLVSANPNSNADIIVDNKVYTEKKIDQKKQSFYSDLAAMNKFLNSKYSLFVRVYDTSYIQPLSFFKKINELIVLNLINSEPFIAANVDKQTYSAHPGSGWIMNRNTVNLWYSKRKNLIELFEEEEGDLEEESHWLLKEIDLHRSFRHQNGFIPCPISNEDFNNLINKKYESFVECELEDGYLSTQVPINNIIIWDGKHSNNVQKYASDIILKSPPELYFYRVNNTFSVCKSQEEIKP